ncbi:hypothetical protein IRZ71_20065 [Flavobacterium sp. ANB]|uniref:gasdermin n=1 Tax=unclassified Flavobacterium TaxID=196869 RepID=UPI0012B94560|nr:MULTISPECIES: hypothetical protein [unclassified Flavobacterium]MBF4518657.1 hypothetical protein [Flavobacterium sp. ANB]MTD67837.1 hypothetical protein [Flavobacterium sp. LC2016-13]
MKLTKYLSGQGYDLIEGPARSHKPLQLWVKKTFDEAQLYYASIEHAFKSDVVLNEIENPALSVDATQKDDYGFNIGITLLEEILKTLGLGTFEISAKIKSGKTVTISYENSITKEYAIGNLEEYLFDADFLHPNPSLLRNANNNNILLITGTVFAKNLVVNIETDFTLDASLITSLNAVAEGKLEFTMSSQSKLKMVSNVGIYFPIAVKANRIDFDRSRFQKLILVTDNINIF